MNTTNSSLLLKRYAALEHEVQRLIESQCGFLCANCFSACCCRTDLCEEAFDSAFLRLLHGQDEKSLLFSERYGWINERGCALTRGRPPICYEFFCDDILDHLPSNLHRYILTTLGRLVSHVGKKALGEKHLVDIRYEAELEQVNAEPLLRQLNESRSALEHIEYFYENDQLEHDGLEQLRKINPQQASIN